MHAQVLQAGLSDQPAHGVRHAADAELNAGAVRNEAHDESGDLFVHFIWGRGRHFDQRAVRPLHEAVDLRDMHAARLIAEGARNAFVDFGNDVSGAPDVGRRNGRGGPEADIPLLIRRRNHQHGDVNAVDEAAADGLGAGVVVHGHIAAETRVAELAAGGRKMPVVIHDVFQLRISQHRLRREGTGGGAQDDIVQLRYPCGKCRIQQHGSHHKFAVGDRIAVFDNGNRFSGAFEFGLVFFFPVQDDILQSPGPARPRAVSVISPGIPVCGARAQRSVLRGSHRSGRRRSG